MEERTAEGHMADRSLARGITTGLGLLLVSLLLAACTTPVSAGTDKLTLGEVLYRLIVGGPAISEVTLLRFYTWHVIALPIIMLALIIWHGFRGRRGGGGGGGGVGGGGGGGGGGGVGGVGGVWGVGEGAGGGGGGSGGVGG